MNRLLIFASTLLVLAAFQSCKETRPEEMIPPTPAYCLEEGSEYLIPLVDSCRIQPFPRMGNIWTPPEEQKYLYGWPMVSPLDKNVIVYTRRQTDTSGTGKFPQVWTMNLCTGEKNLLATELVSGLSISHDGWLTYRTYDGNWKIKPNGDSLTQLETPMIDFDWHPSGQQMVGKTLEDRWALLDDDGQLIQMLDSIQGHRNPRWSPDGEHISFNGFTNFGSFVYLYNVSNQQINQIPVSLKFGYSFWVDNDHLLVPHQSGDLVKLNIHTQQIVEVIKPACVNKDYAASSLSQDGQFLLCGYSINEESTPGSSLLNRYTKLIVMNLDGSNEREIVVE